jgi:hypothetical protein
MLNKQTKEKLLNDYEPKDYRSGPVKEDVIEQKTNSVSRRGSLFRVDFIKVIEKREFFTFSKFINELIE